MLVPACSPGILPSEHLSWTDGSHASAVIRAGAEPDRVWIHDKGSGYALLLVSVVQAFFPRYTGYAGSTSHVTYLNVVTYVAGCGTTQAAQQLQHLYQTSHAVNGICGSGRTVTGMPA